jgi:hypothetical protein
MQTAINPALAAAMTLERAAQVGEFQPMTREGHPTVAAQLMQKAMPPAPPAVPDVARQAGLGGQIQAMQMQEAQKQLMNRLMQQQQAPGIAGLNPQMGNFAQGGIVGYAGDEDSMVVDPQFGGSTEQALVDEEIRMNREADRKERERRLIRQRMDEERRRNQDIVANEGYTRGDIRFPAEPAPQQPPAPPREAPQAAAQAPAMGNTSRLLGEAQALVESMNRRPVPMEQGIEAALKYGQDMDAYRGRLGLPGRMQQVGAQEAEMMRLMGEREKKVSERMQQLEAEKGQQGLINFLLGARGFKGEGIGQVLKTGAQSARSYDEAVRGRMQGLEDLKMDIQMLSFEKRNALAKMRDDIATGDFKSAMDREQQAINADNELKKARAELKIKEAELLSGEARARMQATRPASEFERYISRLEQLSGKPFTAEQLRKEYADFRGAGQAGGRDIRMQESANKSLEDFKKSIDYISVIDKPAEREAALNAKKRELMQQYPGAVFEIGQAGGPTTVTFPNGKTYTFPTPEAAEKAKREAGIK